MSFIEEIIKAGQTVVTTGVETAVQVGQTVLFTTAIIAEQRHEPAGIVLKPVVNYYSNQESTYEDAIDFNIPDYGISMFTTLLSDPGVLQFDVKTIVNNGFLFIKVQIIDEMSMILQNLILPLEAQYNIILGSVNELTNNFIPDFVDLAGPITMSLVSQLVSKTSIITVFRILKDLTYNNIDNWTPELVDALSQIFDYIRQQSSYEHSDQLVTSIIKLLSYKMRDILGDVEE